MTRTDDTWVQKICVEKAEIAKQNSTLRALLVAREAEIRELKMEAKDVRVKVSGV